MEKKRIGVLTGGGDCAGLNSAIKWVVKTALDDRLQKTRKIEYEVVGIRDGWKGLVLPDGDEDDPTPRIGTLTEEMVRTWDRYGGTMLGTSRTNPYDPKNDRSKIVLENIERYHLDYLSGHWRRRYPRSGSQALSGRCESGRHSKDHR